MAISEQFAPSLWAPFRIAPWFAERVWGYRDLRPWYDRIAEGGKPIGEAWLTGDQCVVASGAHAGQTLGALFAEAPESLLGKAAPRSASPLRPSFASAQARPRTAGAKRGRRATTWSYASSALAASPAVIATVARPSQHSGACGSAAAPAR